MGDFNLGDKAYLVTTRLTVNGNSTDIKVSIENVEINAITEYTDKPTQYRFYKYGFPFLSSVQQDEALFKTAEEAETYAKKLKTKYDKERKEREEKRKKHAYEVAERQATSITQLLTDFKKELDKDGLIWLLEHEYIDYNEG